MPMRRWLRVPGTSISEKARERFSLLAENLLRDRGVAMELTEREALLKKVEGILSVGPV